jgi:hypothetical protein
MDSHRGQVTCTGRHRSLICFWRSMLSSKWKMRSEIDLLAQLW